MLRNLFPRLSTEVGLKHHRVAYFKLSSIQVSCTYTQIHIQNGYRYTNKILCRPNVDKNGALEENPNCSISMMVGGTLASILLFKVIWSGGSGGYHWVACIECQSYKSRRNLDPEGSLV